MALPTDLYQLYLQRFQDLIGDGVELRDTMPPQGIKATDEEFEFIYTWRLNCISLLEQVVYPSHPNFGKWNIDFVLTQSPKDPAYINTRAIISGLAYLRSFQDEFKSGMLRDLRTHLEAEISGDYMGQAERLLEEGEPGQFDHVPAAVLAGAVLEKSLKVLCLEQKQPLAIINDRGKPLMMNRLIENLKKEGIFNELKAKHLKAWTDIRNSAAHGEFTSFTKEDVKGMIEGVKNFIADHLL